MSNQESEKMSDPRLKQIKIKTGVLKRVGKEKLSYRKEADQQKAKIEKMKEEGREEVGSNAQVLLTFQSISVMSFRLR